MEQKDLTDFAFRLLLVPLQPKISSAESSSKIWSGFGESKGFD